MQIMIDKLKKKTKITNNSYLYNLCVDFRVLTE